MHTRGTNMVDLIIRGARVVTPDGVHNWDIAIEGEKIAAVGALDAKIEAARTIDASGKIAVPGGVEPHAHLATFVTMHPDRREFTLGPEQDTIGMAFGGTTTHIDFCFVHPAIDTERALQQRIARWKGQSYVDYSFHVALGGPLPTRTFDQIAEA